MKNSKRPLGLIISASILATVMVIGVVILQIKKVSHLKERSKVEKMFQVQNEQASFIEDTKRKRALFFTKNLLLHYPSRYSYAVADFVRQLSIVMKKSIRSVKLDIVPGGQSFSFSLHGKISSPNHGDASLKFKTFYEKLKSFENLIEGSSTGVREYRGNDKKMEFIFEINGEVGLE